MSAMRRLAEQDDTGIAEAVEEFRKFGSFRGWKQFGGGAQIAGEIGALDRNAVMDCHGLTAFN
jgi:hypothetical protein